MYCKYCGKEITDDSVFCQFCGKKLNDGTVDSINQEKDAPKKNNNHTWIFVLLAIIIGVGYYFVKDEKTYGKINGHEYVDLGLPSGLKWATCNVGDNKPEDYGNYYAWGEIKTKSEYTTDNSVTYGKKFNDIIGDARYDATRANWGSTWRLPTKAELEELNDKCTWTWMTQGGKKGYKVTGPNGNSIFLPAAGDRDGTSLNFDGYYGGYWSSTPNDSDYGIGYDAYELVFAHDDELVDYSIRCDGQTVRPVSE